ncbi:MAG: glutamate--tRNA ligase [Alphaproteobacteria bacterium]|nr:glutamate--tRNA ligase [Alphaproteobacteria bacterium]
MAPVVRFAPSPTGRLHLGSARLAVINALFARTQGGTFVLRIDDTDTEQSRADYDQAIRDDLAWLGLGWDRLARQSARLARYTDAFKRLRDEARVYACYETEDELARLRAGLRARGLPPVYDRLGLRLGDADRRRLEAEDRRPHWRFLLDAGSVAWTDLVRGPQAIDAGSLSDPVLVRADGAPTYTLASIVDDLEIGITHVIRGEDHVANTAVQLQIAEALGAAPGRFAFAHLPLLVDRDGAKLSKRDAALGLGALREAGVEAMTIVSLFARLGSSAPVEPFVALDQAVAGFDLERFGRAPVRFDPHELDVLNQRVVAGLPFAAVADRLVALGVAGGAPFWEAVRANCARVADVADWWRVVAGPLAPVVEDAALLAHAVTALPPEPWDAATWAAWTGAVAAATGSKGRALYRPLRLALTGLDHGPEMRYLLPLVGRDRVLARLKGQPS